MLCAPMEGRHQSKREHLRQLVAEKQRWSEPLTEADKAKGFLGWHERGYLPHYDHPGLVQFITFRLSDSLPANRREEWKHLLGIENKLEWRRKLEEYLDRGLGECYLRDKRVAEFTESALLHHHGKRFRLLGWVVMPNHVHILIEVWRVPLARIVQNWKSIIAVESNRILQREGRFWQPEYWERFMRDVEQTKKAARYIEANPVKAQLCRAPEDWAFSSARYRNPETMELEWRESR